MTRGRWLAGPLLAVSLLSACRNSGSARSSGSTGGPTTAGPTSTSAPPTTRPGATTTTAGGGCAVAHQEPPSGTTSADFPTALAFAPDGRLFFAERAGTVKVVQDGRAKAFATVSTVTTERGGGYSERGLLGLAIDPNFNQNRYVYAFYSDPNYTEQHVIRWTDCNGTGMAAKTLITFPSGDDCCHKGGRLAFGPDGKLYVTLGEEHDSPAAQSTSDVRGKVLRYNPDGSIPSDNPFGANDPVWVYGLRNPYGIAFSPSGQLAITNNGPTGEISGLPSTGYDTVILAAPRGAGYQWANCYGYSHPLPGSSSCGNTIPPDWSSEQSTVVPTGATFVDQSGPSAYAGKLVVCSFEGGGLVFTPGQPHGAEAKGPDNCRLDVKEGPDHALYFSDSNNIYRLG